MEYAQHQPVVRGKLEQAAFGHRDSWFNEPSQPHGVVVGVGHQRQDAHVIAHWLPPEFVYDVPHASPTANSAGSRSPRLTSRSLERQERTPTLGRSHIR